MRTSVDRRPSFGKRLAWRMQALALAVFWSALRALPPAAGAAIGGAIFAVAGPMTRKHDFVTRNLALAFPDRHPRQIAATARGVWRNFGAVLAEYPHLCRFRSDARGTALDIRIAPESAAIVGSREPAVYVAAHLANWELASVAMTRLGIPFSAVYAPQGNPHVDAMLQARRGALGCRFIGKRNAIRSLIAALGAGRSVGLLPDQRYDSGELLPFFGRPAQTAVSPAWLALRLERPLIPLRVERTGPSRYTVEFHAPLNCAGHPRDSGAVIALSCALNALFESWISRRPEQWLCMRRRWPARTTRPPAAGSLQPCA